MEQNELGFIEDRLPEPGCQSRERRSSLQLQRLMVVGDGNGNVGFGLGKARKSLKPSPAQGH